MSRKIWKPENPTPGWFQAEKDSDLTIYLPYPDGDLPMFFRRIPAGSFRMGCRGNDTEVEPVHFVTIPEEFYLGTFPVTQNQYLAMASAFPSALSKVVGNSGATPSISKGHLHPVECVNWEEVVALCSELTKSGFFHESLARMGLVPDSWQAGLPSETMWEFACRAGTETEYWNGDGKSALAEVDWYNENSKGVIQTVGDFPSNAWGLYDLHGNVHEWCADVWDSKAYRKRINGWSCKIWRKEDTGNDGYIIANQPPARVSRGGNWQFMPIHCHVAHRGWKPAHYQLTRGGIRLCVLLDSGKISKSEVEPSQQNAVRRTALETTGHRSSEVGIRSNPLLGEVTFPLLRGNDIFLEVKPPDPMTSTPPDSPRAVSSEDGKTWQQSGTTRESQWPAVPDPSVVKLVLGTLDDAKEGNNWDEVIPVLASGLKDHFPNLTHLHIWGLPMAKLGSLPEGLEALDVRKCSRLSELPVLPDTLETLDLAECIALNNLPKQGIASLRWFHVDGCSGIPSNRISSFLEDCLDLEEFTAKGCSHLVELTLPPQESTAPDGNWHPQFPPRRLKKLVLEGCSGLTKFPDLSVYPWLHHLNLNKCSALESIQSLPAGWTEEGDYEVGIRYLLTEGCERLHTFCDLDVRKIHLSVTVEDNVARVWRTMTRLSGDNGEMVMSKLLLLGSGRCGKTTISKAIRGENVRVDEDSTRNIQFYQWDTDFRFRSGEAKAGTVHIWDFGGQEIYHNTHRLFASEGSVFIIATTDPETHKARLKKELDAISDKREKAFYERENEYREFKYWLDYLRSALGLASIDDLKSSQGKVSILVVHTGGGGEEAARKYLRRQAGPYAELLDHDIRIVAVDFHAKSSAEPTRLILSWLREALGGAADRYGMKVPKLFSKVSQRVAKELREARLDRMFLSFEAWTALVTEQTPGLQVFNDRLRRKIEIEQSDAVATHLHRCGIVFKFRKSKGGYEVMVNQKWGIETIYTLTTNKVATSMKAYTQRTFGGERLREIMNYHSVKWLEMSPERCDLVLDLLDQCDVCARLWADEWIAVQKELLPDNGDKIATEMARMWESTAATYLGLVNHSFALHGDQGSMLGDSDFRKVLAYFAREQMGKVLDCLLPESAKQRQEREPGYHQRSRGADLCLWSNGFQIFLEADIEGKKSTAVVRVEWKPCGEGSFEGGLFVQILCSDDDDSGKRFQDLLFGDGGPLAIFKDRFEKSDTRVPDLSQEEMPKLRGVGQPGWLREDAPPHAAVRHDVALSYRSPQAALADEIIARLKATRPEILIYHYRDDQRLKLSGKEEESRISEIYRYLKSAKVLIAIASKDYFEGPDLGKGSNLYCPVELAGAIASFPEMRAENCFFWVFADEVSNKNFEPLLAGGTEEVPQGLLDVYFERVIKPRRPSGLKDLRSSLRKYEEEAVRDAGNKVDVFVEALGPDSKQSVDSRRTGWVESLTQRVLNSIQNK